MQYDAAQGVNSIDLTIGRDRGVVLKGDIDSVGSMEKFIFQGECRVQEEAMTEMHSICGDDGR